jgi:molybdopterin-guanine dinucleotide biosynthesis protein A
VATTPAPDASLTGVVLCGGLSTRMGREKADLPFGAETMLERVARVLGMVAREVLVVARADQQVPGHLRVVRDPVDGSGPLAGIAAGLAACTTDRALVVACDLPLVKPAVLRAVAGKLQGFDLCVPEVEGRLVATCAAYHTRVRPLVETHLARGRLRVTDLCAAAHTRIVPASELVDLDPSLDSFHNCNTLDDYRRALERAGLSPL